MWVNGTTDMRFDLGKNEFKSIATGNTAKLSPFSPMYLTSNIKYAFGYVSSHINKDYKKEVKSVEATKIFAKNQFKNVNYTDIEKRHRHGLFVFV